ncbi:hypothetical protein PV11_06457 [Exophiala sideris]|uniref:BZIP domain-containing protein n=1 Tax=Exophiala sideris TaxID=1016849 RepID=A0A0D1YVF7_9EURO|nr:hypothetical protein PV11_06457 [Exophiala sideris]
MPTTDPVKRRKQNCENQKRWRQRQVDTLERLTDALEKSESRTKQLETETLDLRDALREARDDIQQLRASNENLMSQIRLLSSAKRSHMVDHEGAGAADIGSMSFAAADSGGIWNQPLQTTSTGAPSEGFDSSPVGPSTLIGDATTDNIITGSGSQNQACLLPQNVTGARKTTSYQRQINAGLPIRTSVSAGHVAPIPQSLEPAFPAYFDPSSLLQQASANQWRNSSITALPPHPHDVTANQLEHESEDAELVTATTIAPHAELTAMSPSYVDNLYFTWTPESMLGGAGGIRRNMLSFPQASPLSGHILAVQNIIHSVLPQMVKKPPIMREKMMADAFSWLIRSAWPSSESCLRTITAYRHIYHFELWRNFPCKTTYYKIHPLYRPTALQLSEPHSGIIDWLPWPAARNKLIEMQNEVDVDQFVLTLLENTLVEPSLSYSAEWTPPSQAAFRLRDMYLVEKSASGNLSISRPGMAYDPAFLDLRALMNAYDWRFLDVTQLRIDQRFCEISPQFYIPGCMSRAQNEPLDAPVEERLQHPGGLRIASVNMLQQRVQAWLTSDSVPEAG